MNNQIEKRQEAPLQKFASEVMAVWADLASIKKVFAPDLTEIEFKIFVGLGMATGANPFLREIWPVKYDKSKPASIFLGRDFYRKKAQQQEDYAGHTSQAVYEKDEFSFDIATGMPSHRYTVTQDRGKIVGAYALAWRKGINRPFYVYVDFVEVSKKQSTWNSQPICQVEKVAEARVLRQTWQATFAGTYSDAEMPIIEESHKPRKDYKKMTEELKKPKDEPVENGKSNPEATNTDRLKLLEKGTKIFGTPAKFTEFLQKESEGKIQSLDNVETKVQCSQFWRLMDQFVETPAANTTPLEFR